MNECIILEWSFSPIDYFEESLDIKCGEYILSITNGKIEAMIDPATFEANPGLSKFFEDKLHSRFLGIQVLTQKPYKLSSSTMSILHSDGESTHYLEVQSAFHDIVGHLEDNIDVITYDANGNILSDSKQDRIEKKRALANLVSKYQGQDKVLDSLLSSNNASIGDPKNELIHLYEIRDALCAKFGKENKVKSTLSISNSDWALFGRICNYEPLHQGRHRGQNPGVLRDATKEELSDARRIAQSMIMSYLRYLENITSGDDNSVLNTGADFFR